MKKSTAFAFLPLLGGLAAYSAAVEAVMSLSLNRRPPLYTGLFLKQNLGEGAGNSAEIERWQERLKTVASERVRIRGVDGTELVGHLFRAKKPRRLILAVHGWRSAWYRDFCGIASFWEREDCSVLYLEQRGQGESGGARLGFGPPETEDCLCSLRWAREHFPGLPIYLSGISMGATTVLLAAGKLRAGEVAGVMADCGYTSPDAIWRRLIEKTLPLPYALLRPAILWRYRQLTGHSAEESTVEALRRCAVPLLLVHGLCDGFVPPEMTRENYAAARGEKRLLLVPGADHGVSYLVDTGGYQQAVRSFFADCEAV